MPGTTNNEVPMIFVRPGVIIRKTLFRNTNPKKQRSCDREINISLSLETPHS